MLGLPSVNFSSIEISLVLAACDLDMYMANHNDHCHFSTDYLRYP